MVGGEWWAFSSGHWVLGDGHSVVGIRWWVVGGGWWALGGRRQVTLGAQEAPYLVVFASALFVLSNASAFYRCQGPFWISAPHDLVHSFPLTHRKRTTVCVT